MRREPSTGPGDGNPPRVLLVDDHELLADSVASALGAEGLEVVRPPSLVLDAVLAAAEQRRPQVVLLDLHLADGVSTVGIIDPLRRLGARVVMVTAETDRMRLAECVEAGAVGIVPKSASFDHLVQAVVAAAGQGSLLAAGARQDLLAELREHRARQHALLASFERLTPRERDVLAGLVEGRSAEAMAEETFVSITTIRSHIHAVLSKLGVSSQLAAVATARAAGWQR